METRIYKPIPVTDSNQVKNNNAIADTLYALQQEIQNLKGEIARLQGGR